MPQVSIVCVWAHLYEFKTPPYLWKLRHFCAGRVPVIPHPSLYKAVKLTYHMDVGGIVLDAWMTSELGVGSLGESVWVLCDIVSVV